MAAAAAQPRGFRDGRVIYLGNDAVYGQGARDPQPDGRPIPDSTPAAAPQQAAFAGLSPEARYELDTHGITVLKSVLSDSELEEARAAFDRMVQQPAAEPHDYSHLKAIVAEPALEALACHPALLMALVELHRGEPHLVSASLNHKPPRPGNAPPQNGAQLHGGAEFANRREYGQDVSVGAEAPGRLHIENCVCFPYLDTVFEGDGGLLIMPGSQKNEFARPPELFGPYATQFERGWDAAKEREEAGPAGWEGWDWSHVPDGLVNLCPTAGDIVIMREAPTGCLHGVMPWTSATRQRRTMTMRYKSGPEWLSHRDHEDHVHRPRQISPRVRSHLGLSDEQQLRPETVALVSGDSGALTGFAQSALRTWERPPAAGNRPPLWRAGRNPSVAMPPGGPPAVMTAEMRFLMDAYGFLHLRAVLSPEEVAAAREVYAEAAQDSGAGTGLVGRPALERLIAHPKLLPIYEEFAGDDQLHLVSAGLLHDQPKAEGAPLQPGGLHCQREYDRHHALFATRPSGLDDDGRISLNNWVSFPYFDAVGPDDGGLLVVPGSHKAVFSRPRSLFYPFGGGAGLGGPNRPATEEWHGPIPVPDGCLHVRPEPGDVVIMAELLAHGIRPWSSTDRSRRAMAIRFKTGAAYAEHMAAWQAKDDGGAAALPDWMLRPERLHGGMSFGTRWEAATLRAASAATLALIGGGDARL